MELYKAISAQRGILTALHSMEQVKAVLSLILSSMSCYKDTADDTSCSELGYIFFEKRNNGYHRIA